MLEAQTIIDRLKTEVPSLGSVEGAAELAALLAAPPQVWTKPRAHVVSLGIRGGPVVAAAGGFIQSIEWTFAVYLTFVAHGDRRGARAMVDVTATQNDVILALCGWEPPETAIAGQMRLTRAYLAELKPGTIVYAVEFAVADQLRIF
jgi:hypothetical protein